MAWRFNHIHPNTPLEKVCKEPCWCYSLPEIPHDSHMSCISSNCLPQLIRHWLMYTHRQVWQTIECANIVFVINYFLCKCRYQETDNLSWHPNHMVYVGVNIPVGPITTQNFNIVTWKLSDNAHIDECSTDIKTTGEYLLQTLQVAELQHNTTYLAVCLFWSKDIW